MPDSENTNQQVEDIDEVEGIPEDTLIECPDEDCPSHDETENEFTVMIEHEIKRHQNKETGEVNAHWSNGGVKVIVCEACKKAMFLGGPYPEDEVNESGNPEGQV